MYAKKGYPPVPLVRPVPSPRSVPARTHARPNMSFERFRAAIGRFFRVKPKQPFTCPREASDLRSPSPCAQ